MANAPRVVDISEFKQGIFDMVTESGIPITKEELWYAFLAETTQQKLDAITEGRVMDNVGIPDKNGVLIKIDIGQLINAGQ